jgi:pyruvate formate lyase activating enzyme
MRRREFIQTAAIGAGFALCPRLVFPGQQSTQLSQGKTALDKNHKPARFYKKLEDGIIECQLCPRQCHVSDLERGYCGVRENMGGEYYTLVHSRVC